MKMSRQNPGGEIVTRPTMKGCEFGKHMGKGKGSSTGGTLVTKYSQNAPGMSGMVKAGHASDSKHKASHIQTPMSGATVTGTSKACRG